MLSAATRWLMASWLMIRACCIQGSVGWLRRFDCRGVAVLMVGRDGIVGTLDPISVKRGSGRWNCICTIGGKEPGVLQRVCH